jgi:hypothetical protein
MVILHLASDDQSLTRNQRYGNDDVPDAERRLM